MGIQPWVIVEAPDARGLRKVVINGEVAGTAWSFDELVRLLGRLGYPPSTDMQDPATVLWRGRDSGIWPDRPWRRRATAALMFLGLLVSAALHMAIGWPDALKALTFAQRIVGAIFVLAGLVQCVAAAAVFDHFGRRRSRVSGSLVLLGAFIALPTSAMLIFMWLEEREYTPYLLVFMPLSLWSVWALVLLVREKAWRGVPQPKKFAAGVVFSGLLTAVSLAYSTMYQPTAEPIRFVLKATFGRPQTDADAGYVAVPLTLYVKNDGGIPVYVVNDDYTVWGSEFSRSEEGEGLRNWAEDTKFRYVPEAERYARATDREVLRTGHFYGPGAWLDAGEEFSSQKVVRLPKDAGYGELEATVSMNYMRKDRGRIDDRFSSPVFSWDRNNKRFYCPPEQCGENVVYHGRVRHNNNLVNVTRRPRYVTAIWSPRRGPSVFISSFDFGTRGLYVYGESIDKAEVAREKDRFGTAMVSANAKLLTSGFLRRPGTG
ncbi:Yip1 family protein [Streptomyces sp. NPDC056600]|uniref:Yip1 family protein n=1 Tax=Streptomyces sp. NPDC056600 TaxID=3345874 RepID=UPI0036950F4A